MTRSNIISALRSIGTPICVNAAAGLEANSGADAAFNLHLRRAGLTVAHAKVLADGLRASNAHDALPLRSFSASFNPQLGDAVALLVPAFPDALTELGLVACGIGDVGGRALLDWARAAPNLQMMCIEGNRFSAQIRAQFEALASGGTRVRIVV